MKREDLIDLSASETAGLMRASQGRVVPLAFGPGWAALQWRDAPWALPLIAEWRGLTFDQGAGI